MAHALTLILATNIKTKRKEKNLSQQTIAKRLGISRPSYIAVEQGKRDLSLPEAEILAGLFDISLESLISDEIPNTEKYQQMVFAFLRNNTNGNKGIPKTKLAKLLYLADFAWFYKHLKSMSGMLYRKIQYGPVPDAYFRIVEELYEEGKIDIHKTEAGAMLISETRSSEREPLNLLNAAEKTLIKKIMERWKKKRTQEIVDFTHQHLPYILCRDGEHLSYALITQEDPGYVY